MIRIVGTPLATVEAEAVLRPVRTDWAPVTPAARRLEQAAGARWAEGLVAQGDLILGSAAITGAGDLPVEFVIHAAVCSPEEGASRRSVELALRNGLRRAREWEIAELAMPLLGTGPGSLDPEGAVEVMAPLLRDHADAGSGAGEGAGERTVLVCVEDEVSERAASILATTGRT